MKWSCFLRPAPALTCSKTTKTAATGLKKLLRICNQENDVNGKQTSSRRQGDLDGCHPVVAAIPPGRLQFYRHAGIQVPGREHAALHGQTPGTPDARIRVNDPGAQGKIHLLFKDFPGDAICINITAGHHPDLGKRCK